MSALFRPHLYPDISLTYQSIVQWPWTTYYDEILFFVHCWKTVPHRPVLTRLKPHLFWHPNILVHGCHDTPHLHGKIDSSVHFLNGTPNVCVGNTIWVLWRIDQRYAVIAQAIPTFFRLFYASDRAKRPHIAFIVKLQLKNSYLKGCLRLSAFSWTFTEICIFPYDQNSIRVMSLRLTNIPRFLRI